MVTDSFSSPDAPAEAPSANPPAAAPSADAPAEAASGAPVERAAAHALLDAFDGAASGAWALPRGAVAARLHELVENPELVRQGALNLCGAASLVLLWLRRDPRAVVTYATTLYEQGQASIGDLPVVASARLRAIADLSGTRCEPADWLMMAGLRDSTNRVLPYAYPHGLREAAAAITVPRVLARWLRATGCWSAVRDETHLLLRKGLPHAYASTVDDNDVVLLIAQELLRQPANSWARTRNAVRAALPNHWVVLAAPIVAESSGRAVLRCYTWGGEYEVHLPESRLQRHYFGALVAHRGKSLRGAGPRA